MGNLHLRFDEGKGTSSVPSYSTGSEKRTVYAQTGRIGLTFAQSITFMSRTLHILPLPAHAIIAFGWTFTRN